MTQQEFEARTNVSLTQELFWEVNEEYNQSEKDVDAFCKWWIKNRLHDYTKRMTSDLYNLTEKVNMLEIRIRLNKTTNMVAFRNDIAEIAKAYGLKSAANGNGLYVDILLHQ